MTFNVSGAHQSDSVIHIHILFLKLFSIIGYYKILTIVPSEKKVNIAQSHLTLCDPMHYTVHGILQARILEWVVFPFSRRSSNPGIEPRSPALQADSLPAEPQGKPKNTRVGSLSPLQQIFPTQESNPGFLHCSWILYQLSYEGSPYDIA